MSKKNMIQRVIQGGYSWYRRRFKSISEIGKREPRERIGSVKRILEECNAIQAKDHTRE